MIIIKYSLTSIGSWTEPIEENMVFTVEPGIYIPEEGIGIRLEDDVVVQKNNQKKRRTQRRETNRNQNNKMKEPRLDNKERIQ